jgi:hypothetical protein
MFLVPHWKTSGTERIKVIYLDFERNVKLTVLTLLTAANRMAIRVCLEVIINTLSLLVLVVIYLLVNLCCDIG